MEYLSQKEFWNSQYLNNQDKWSINSVNPVFIYLLENYVLEGQGKFLFPGAGKSFEPLYTASKGFDVTVVDFSSDAIEINRKLVEVNRVQFEIVEDDFFNFSQKNLKQFNFLYEYVFLCAVNPSRRKELIKAFAETLVENGTAFILLFPIDERIGGPPFTILPKEFEQLTSNYFDINEKISEIPSIKPRKGKEILYILRKKKYDTDKQ